MASLSDLLVKLDMDSARFREELNRAGNELGKFGEQIAKAGDLVKHALEFEIIKQATEQLFEFVKAGAEAADQLEKLSQRTGIGVEQLQKLQYAANIADVSHEQLGKGLDKLAKNMAAAATQGGKQAEAFDAMTISVKDAEGKLRPTADVLGDVAEKFSRYKDGAEKSALAQVLFGKTGAELIPLLNQGREGLAALGDEAERFGIILDEQTIRGAAEFEEDLKKLHSGASGLKTVLAAEMAPTLDAIAKQMLEGARNGGQLREFMDGLATVFKIVAVGGQLFAGVLEYLGTRIAGVAASLTLLLSGDFKGAVATWKQHGDDLQNVISDTLDRAGATWNAKAKEIGKEGLNKQDQNAPLLENAKRGAADALAVLDAQTKSALALQKEDARERGAVLDDSYKIGTTSLQDYYDERIKIQQESYGKEISLLKKKIAEVRAEEADADPGEKTKYSAKLIDLTGQLDLAQTKMLHSSIDLRRQEDDAIRSQIKARQELAIASQQKLDQAGIVAQTDELQHQRALMQVTDENYYNRLKQLEDQSLDNAREIERERLENFVGTADARELAVLASQDRLTELEVNHAEKIKQIDRQMESDRAKYALAAEASIKSSLENEVTAFLDGTKTLKQAFLDLTKSILQNIEQMLAKQWVEQLFGSGSGGGGFLRAFLGIAGSAFGGGSEGALAVPAGIDLNSTSGAFADAYQTPPIAGFRAAGGPVSAGSSYVVGEKGPEIFTPDSSGSITPNGAGNSIVVNVNVEKGQSDAGGDGNNKARQLGNVISAVVRDELIQQKRPGGLLA